MSDVRVTDELLDTLDRRAPIEMAIRDAFEANVAVGDRLGVRRAILAIIDMASAEERESCIEILQKARLGEIDSDLRCLISRIRNRGKPE